MIAALLLAAGKSSRMGAFKPLLPFGDTTVLEACIDSLLSGGVEEVIVVVGHRADEIREKLAHRPVSIALNSDPESEMGVSIARGVERVSREAEGVFIALVDQPAIPPEVVRLLIAERTRTAARLVQPEHKGRGGHPVLVDLVFRRELLDLDPERGLRALFDAHREEILRVEVATPYVARDMDQWDDYRQLYLDVFGTVPPGHKTEW